MPSLEEKLHSEIMKLTQFGSKAKGDKYGMKFNTLYKLVIDSHIFMIYRNSLKELIKIKITKTFPLINSPDCSPTQNIIYWEINKKNQLVKSKSYPREANPDEINFFSNQNNKDN